MKELVTSIVLAITFLALTSCPDDESTSPNYEDAIIGIWEATITDDEGVTFKANIIFQKSGFFDFKLVEETPGHNDSYAQFEIDSDQLKFFNDSDCGDIEGNYRVSIELNLLTLTSINDECAPRKKAIARVWQFIPGN